MSSYILAIARDKLRMMQFSIHHKHYCDTTHTTPTLTRHVQLKVKAAIVKKASATHKLNNNLLAGYFTYKFHHIFFLPLQL